MICQGCRTAADWLAAHMRKHHRLPRPLTLEQIIGLHMHCSATNCTCQHRLAILGKVGHHGRG